MRRIDAGTSGESASADVRTWESLDLPEPWPGCISILSPGEQPRPVQVLAFGEMKMLGSRRNLIVSAPTNAGKSLIGHVALLQAVQAGKRGILLEPLRALAQERADELRTLTPDLSKLLGRRIRVRVSTGDYRLLGEQFASPPPAEGEIVIATPERFDAILRNPSYAAWVESIGAVCVDEAHLISSGHRGPTLEYVVTSLLCLPVPPRIVLLSASLGDTERARSWLSPCDVARVSQRWPALRKEVIELSENEDANEAAIALTRDILASEATNVLIFVYQTRSAERLAGLLRDALGASAGVDGPFAYHAQMSAQRRQAVRESFQAGRSRCLVATSALALGVNLPATHVMVRDTTYPGVGLVSAPELLQMMGRAGRGVRDGCALAVVRANDGWPADELASALRKETLPGLVSHIDREEGRERRRRDSGDTEAAAVARHVAAYLARSQDMGVPAALIRAFFNRSLGGAALAGKADCATMWLSDPRRALAYDDERGSYRLTVLGLRAARSMLPLELAAGFAQLIRDLLSLDPTDGLLGQWEPLDHLLGLNLLYEGSPALRRFSDALVDEVDMWMERQPAHGSLLYRKWIVGQRGASRASEVLGSLGIVPSSSGSIGDEWCRKAAYGALFRSIVLSELGNGVQMSDLERRWRINGLEGMEERWRDDFLWLLAGIASVCDLRCFYFHLKEECAADGERIRRVKRLLSRIRAQTFDSQEMLKYCSPLGPMLRGLRKARARKDGESVGINTIRRLEGAGVRSLMDLVPMGTDDLVGIGVRRDLARQIQAYMRRRVSA